MSHSDDDDDKTNDIKFNILNLNNNSNNQDRKERFLTYNKWKCLESENIQDNYILLSNEIRQVDIDSLEKEILSQEYGNLKSYNIRPISDVDFLINSITNINNIDEYKKELKKYKYRNILGDGNCFYRGFIFSFMENIILSQKIDAMKELFILFDEKINNENEKVKNEKYISDYIKNINSEEIKKILCIIISKMNSNNNDNSVYEFFIKAFLFYKYFDEGLIYFTRYLIYEYISSNEDCKYSQQRNIKIGTTLPKKYIENDQFLFKKYYEEHLMKMGEFAESIDIEIIPFVFNVNINILEINSNLKKLYKYECHNEIKFQYNINLLYINGNHYDVYYEESIYKKYLNQKDDYKIEIILLPQIEKEIDTSYKNFLTKSSIEDIDNFDIYMKKVPFDGLNYKTTLFDMIEKMKNNINIAQIIREIKKKICLVCGNEIKQSNNIYIEFPCGCRICSEECYEKKKKIIEENEGEIYEDKYYYAICCPFFLATDIDTIDKNDSDKNQENPKKISDNEYIESIWKWRCMICYEKFNRRFRYYRIIFKDENKLNRKKKLEHLICIPCKDKIIKDKKINCKLCKHDHEIRSIKNLSENNEVECDCIII